MKRYSKKWMQSFVDGQLPDDKVLIEQMSKKAFEVESVENITDPDGKTDSLFEIKVLPNRVPDAMSLEGMARELATVFDFKMHDWRPKINILDYKINKDFVLVPPTSVKGDNPLLRFTGFKVNLNSQAETPEWIKDILVKSGGRSINCLVDITNLILFSMGQPAHVFDFEKLNGKIITRFAKTGEEITLLDGKKVNLKETDFLITDEKHALSIAGIKGGKLAEVDINTKVAYFELANFSPAMIRKTTQSVGVRTDASKIFENGISTEKTLEALKVCIGTVKEIYPQAEIEFVTDILTEEKRGQEVEVSLKNINNYGGTNLTFLEIKKILERQNFTVEETKSGLIKVVPPHERLDINIEEDIAEEVLRIFGFDNLPSKELNFPHKIEQNVRFILENYLKLKLESSGYTEVYNYTFVDKGDVKVKLGLASDKEYLRNNLSDGAQNTFTKNYNYLPILETTILKFFEIGMVFLAGEVEDKRCVIVCDDNKKKTKYLEELKNLLLEIENELELSKTEIIKSSDKPATIEFSIDKMVEEIKLKNIVVPFVEITKNLQDIKYSKISIYPFIVRDIAMFVPAGFYFQNLKLEILNLKLSNLENIYIFDSFSKKDEEGNEKTSVAFRIIFQSYDKTLTDLEVETEMQKVYIYLKDNNFEIR